MILQWAINNVQLVEFTFCNGTTNSTSSGVIKSALLSFTKGWGIWISDSRYMGSTNDPAGRQSFRDTLVDKIHVLTGSKPRLVQQENAQGKMQWVIGPALPFDG